jgi:hypothetical protein
METEKSLGHRAANVYAGPDYYYCRHMGSYKLYHDHHDGTADKIDQNWNEEVIRKRCYELNGWNYKPKDAKQ